MILYFCVSLFAFLCDFIYFMFLYLCSCVILSFSLFSLLCDFYIWVSLFAFSCDFIFFYLLYLRSGVILYFCVFLFALLCDLFIFSLFALLCDFIFFMFLYSRSSVIFIFALVIVWLFCVYFFIRLTVCDLETHTKRNHTITRIGEHINKKLHKNANIETQRIVSFFQLYESTLQLTGIWNIKYVKK